MSNFQFSKPMTITPDPHLYNAKLFWQLHSPYYFNQLLISDLIQMKVNSLDASATTSFPITDPVQKPGVCKKGGKTSTKLQRKQLSERVYIDQVRDSDILCGRGGKSNHHPGNKRYRQVVSDMKLTYKNTEKKLKKTDLSREIVDLVCNYGGRFIKKDNESDKYYLLTRAEARRKTSQALREQKEIKWT